MEPTKKQGAVNSARGHPKIPPTAGDDQKAPTRRNGPKSTRKAGCDQKALARRNKKALTRRNRKAPSNYIPSVVSGFVDRRELEILLRKRQQHEWCSRVRLLGLMLLIEFFARRRSSKGVSCSIDLSHGYVSKIGRPRSHSTIREPLAVLRKIGVLRLAQPAVNGWHVKTSALYAFHNDYARLPIQQFHVVLPGKLAKKREMASERCEKRLCRRQPFRARLQTDLQKLGFDPAARSMIAEYMRNPNMKNSTQGVMESIDCKKHVIRQSPRGQITTSIHSCPKALKKLLVLDGEPTVSCDMSHAHHCFMPRILGDRISYIQQEYGASARTANHEKERSRLIAFLSEGDYYRKWCVNPDSDLERKEKKMLVNMILNWRNDKCAGNGLYKRMCRKFPLTFRVIEDIKRKNHRNISKHTQCYTAKAICGALLELQGKGIAAIPDMDALICQKRHREAVCEAIGRQVYEVSGGVCCKVDDLRYEPPALATCHPAVLSAA